MPITEIKEFGAGSHEYWRRSITVEDNQRYLYQISWTSMNDVSLTDNKRKTCL